MKRMCFFLLVAATGCGPTTEAISAKGKVSQNTPLGGVTIDPDHIDLREVLPGSSHTLSYRDRNPGPSIYCELSQVIDLKTLAPMDRRDCTGRFAGIKGLFTPPRLAGPRPFRPHDRSLHKLRSPVFIRGRKNISNARSQR